MRALKLTTLAFVLAVGFSGSAQADAVWASHVGGTCVPDSATIRAGKYETAGFGVRFANGIGAIRLLCPFGLDGKDATIGGMQLSVIDGDGGGADGHIRASLRRAVKGTNVWIEIGSCDSNQSTRQCRISWYLAVVSEWLPPVALVSVRRRSLLRQVAARVAEIN